MASAKKLVVMISGEGTNLQALIDACSAKYIDATIVGVVSNKINAGGVKRAQNANIHTVTVPFNKSMDRKVYDTQLASMVKEFNPDLIVLAGWMHVLTSEFLDVFPKRVVNLHPALPGTFVGANGIAQAYMAFKKGEITSTGVMTHFVIPEVDKGDYIQALRIPILPNDTIEDLSARVKKHEKDVLVSTVKYLTDPVESSTEKKEPFKRALVGKVRDVFDIGHDLLALSHSNRLSAFDRHICEIPTKGAVLTSSSAFWFNELEKLGVKNHYLWSSDNVMITKKCKVFPIEVVVRGFITGSTRTSLWTHYKSGVRNYCGIEFPDGLTKHQRLDHPVITPTTKGEVDEPISAEDIVKQGLATQEQWDYMADTAMKIFTYGQELAESRGLLLVDTKYEFGLDKDGNILLIDEVHTCDSSRFWFSNTYESRLAEGKDPQKYDKDVVRDYVKGQYSDPYGADKIVVPSSCITDTKEVYHNFYNTLTGNYIPDKNYDSLKNLVDTYYKEVYWRNNPTVVILAGSPSDQKHIDKISTCCRDQGLHTLTHISSAHKNTRDVLEKLEYFNKGSGKIVFVTVAGMSNALSGVTACNTNYPVIACPPFSDKDDQMLNINSTLQMPSKVPTATILSPGNVALFIKRMFAL